MTPDVPLSVMTPLVVTPSQFTANVKLDIKQYPTFNGEIGSWRKFKSNVLAIAATHGLEDVFDTKYKVPDPTAYAYVLFQEKTILFI